MLGDGRAPVRHINPEVDDLDYIEDEAYAAAFTIACLAKGDMTSAVLVAHAIGLPELWDEIAHARDLKRATKTS